MAAGRRAKTGWEGEVAEGKGEKGGGEGGDWGKDMGWYAAQPGDRLRWRNINSPLG